MGSLFTTTDKLKQKTQFGGSVTAPFYLQFVPGVCVQPVTSMETLHSMNDESTTNSILAIPHISNKPKKKKTQLNDDDRYYPLFRGIFEVPAKGDPVLLCTIGGKQYYLGPLNTENNVNFNTDNLHTPEIPLGTNRSDFEQNPILARGESLNFRKVPHMRMNKAANKKLDGEKAFRDTHGDIMLEGRHGNSVRVGSRSDNPYVYISNGRHYSYMQEGFPDGSLIAITKKGSLNQHFGGYGVQIKEETAPDGNNPRKKFDREIEFIDGFILASDFSLSIDKKPKRLMGSLVSSVNNKQNVKDLIYKYGESENQNQVLISSDRITFNSKSDDIYLSSKKDIHIGTRRHLTISTNEKFIIESENVYIGNPNTKKTQGIVLGEDLKKVLKDIVNLFSEVKAISLLGANPLIPSPNVSKVITSIDKILSTKHFVESN